VPGAVRGDGRETLYSIRQSLIRGLCEQGRCGKEGGEAVVAHPVRIGVCRRYLATVSCPVWLSTVCKGMIDLLLGILCNETEPKRLSLPHRQPVPDSRLTFCPVNKKESADTGILNRTLIP
jgi:hypothetical protein